MALIWCDRWRFYNSASLLHAYKLLFHPFLLLPPTRFFWASESISLDFHFHAPIARVCNRAARRMAAKGYRCTSNYDQCVPFDLTTLFSPGARSSAEWKVQSAPALARDNLNKMGANKTLLIYTRFSPSLLSDFSQCCLALFTPPAFLFFSLHSW